VRGGDFIWERRGCEGFALLRGGRITYLGDPVELSFGGCVIDRGKWLGEQGAASGTVLLSFVVRTLSRVLDHRYQHTEN